MAGPKEVSNVSGSPPRARRRPHLKTIKTGTWEEDADLEKGHAHGSGQSWRSFFHITFQTVGVVYGDIGTSPLYAVAAIFGESGNGQPPTPEDVVGIISLIIWVLTAIVAIEYAAIVLRADDNGQGGAFALFSLLKRQAGALPAGTKPPSAKEDMEGPLQEVDLHQLDSGLQQYTVTRSHPTISGALRNVLSSRRTQAVPEHEEDDGRAAAPQQAATTPVVDWRQRFISNRRVQQGLRILVVVAVGMIMGDGVLTPAISVVSACEGLLIPVPSLPRVAIVGIALVIIVLLFIIQRFGTRFIGTLFSPIITIWFLFNAVMGIYNIARYQPSIFKALAPNYWFSYFLRRGHVAWKQLGGVLLCVTGAEALYADMGNFSRRSIQASFYTLVYPSLVLTYLGQGAYLINNPEDFSQVFWRALPAKGVFWPMFIVATLSAIIASQALISAVFQIVSQAISQSFFPRFQQTHTSAEHPGQVYIPFINYLLMILCIIVVATFQTSEKLGRAYGLAVICDMLMTTHFLTLVMVCVWRLPLVLPMAFYLVYATIQALFLSSTAEKVPQGGWFSLMMAAIYACIMLLWSWGSSVKDGLTRRRTIGLHQLMAIRKEPKADHERALLLLPDQSPVHCIPGVALYYTEALYGAPPVLTAHLQKFPALHDINIFVTVSNVPVPQVLQNERILLRPLGIRGFFHCVARYGYMETVDHGQDFVTELLEDLQRLLYADLLMMIREDATLRDLLPSRYPDVAHGSPEAAGYVSEAVGSAMEGIREEDNSINGKIDGANVPSTPSVAGTENTLELPHPPGENAGNGQTLPTSPSHGPSYSAPPIPKSPFEVQREDLLDPSLSLRTVRRSSRVLHPLESFRQTASVLEDPNLTLNTATRTALEKAAQALRAGPLVADGDGIVLRSVSARALAEDIGTVAHAKARARWVAVTGLSHPRIREDANFVRRYCASAPFLFLVNNFEANVDASFNIPATALTEVGMPYDI